MIRIRIIKAAEVIPIAIPTLLLRVLSLYGMQSWHFLPTTEKLENAQKLEVFVVLVV